MRENEWVVLLLAMVILLMSGVVGALNVQYGFLDGFYGFLFNLTSQDIPTSCPTRYYNYGAIFYNLSTPSGDYPVLMSPEYTELFEGGDGRGLNMQRMLRKGDCVSFIDINKRLNNTYVIVYDEDCYTLLDCKKLYPVTFVQGRQSKCHIICLFKLGEENAERS